MLSTHHNKSASLLFSRKEDATETPGERSRRADESMCPPLLCMPMIISVRLHGVARPLYVEQTD
jgi:hypothetical protein